MTKHGVEQALREWIEEDTDVPEPPGLRERVMAVPHRAHVGSQLRWSWAPRWLRPPRLGAAMAAVVLLMAFAFVFDPFASTEEPGTLSVAQDGSGQFTTIADAVAEATDGDLVLVSPGTYLETIRIDKDITLRGDGQRGDVVITSPTELVPRYLPRDEHAFAIRVEGADVSFEDLALTGPASSLIVLGGSQQISDVVFDSIGLHDEIDPESSAELAGLILAEGSSAEVRDSLFRWASVIVDPGATAVIEDNELLASWVAVGHGRWGVPGRSPAKPALIGANDSSSGGTVITGNTWTDAPDGIFVGYGETVMIEDNVFSGSDEVAIMVWSAREGSTIRGNTISGGKTALLLTDDTGIHVADNVISGNQIGMNISGHGATLSGNEIRDNTVGVIVANVPYGTSPTLEHNTIEGNTRGLSISAGASPILRSNVVCGNELNLNLVEGADATFEDNEICPDEVRR